MAPKSIQAVPISTDDWTVREDGGRELGHYSSQQDALHVGRKLARKHGARLLVRDLSGETPAETAPKGLFARLLGR